MKLEKYQQHLATLIKPGHEILETLTPQKVTLWHLASALQGELAELADAMDSPNYKEEFGDALFYLHGIALVIKEYEPLLDSAIGDLGLWEIIHPIDSDYPFNTAVHWKSNLVISAGHLFDLIKKHVIYNKILAAEQLTELYRHWLAIRYLLLKNAGDPQYCGWSEEELLQANIEKLSKRYPGLLYGDAHAQERKDKEEEKVTAELQNWYIEEGRLCGNIYNDKRGLYPDGTFVRTTLITEMPKDLLAADTPLIVRTQNSSYRLMDQDNEQASMVQQRWALQDLDVEYAAGESELPNVPSSVAYTGDSAASSSSE